MTNITELPVLGTEESGFDIWELMWSYVADFIAFPFYTGTSLSALFGFAVYGDIVYLAVTRFVAPLSTFALTFNLIVTAAIYVFLYELHRNPGKWGLRGRSWE